MAHELNADRARFQTGSVHPAADKAMDSAPAPRISLPTCPRRPLLCPRTSLTVTAKKPAHWLAPRQSCRNGITGEHADSLRDRRAAAPARSTRCAKAQLAAESRGSSTGRMRSSSAPRSRDISSAGYGKALQRTKRTPNHPLSSNPVGSARGATDGGLMGGLGTSPA